MRHRDQIGFFFALYAETRYAEKKTRIFRAVDRRIIYIVRVRPLISRQRTYILIFTDGLRAYYYYRRIVNGGVKSSAAQSN